jgi:hypothetical protein
MQHETGSSEGRRGEGVMAKRQKDIRKAIIKKKDATSLSVSQEL